MATPQMLALDIGQSGTRVAIDGHRVDQSLPSLRGHLPVTDQLARLAERAVELAGGGSMVAMGSTGVESLTIAGDLRSRLAAPIETVLVAHDSVTSYLGSVGVRPGCVLAVGTGSVALAVGTTAARADGWGSLVGDAGSGYWIGRAAIEAALRAEDGRGRPTALRALVAERFDGLDLLGVRLQADPDRVRLIASCAKDVAAVAASDESAAEITDTAGRELAATVRAACLRAGLDGDVVVVATGNALASAALQSAFDRHLGELVPYGRREAPAGDGLDGAGLLASVPENFGLHQLISRA